MAFLVLGPARVEPLDFWWGPFDAWLLTAYTLILVGGVLITRRLHLLPMVLAFWLTLAAGLGVLAAWAAGALLAGGGRLVLRDA